MVDTTKIKESLTRAKFKSDMISIVVHNLEGLEKSLKADQISIVVHNLENEPKFAKEFAKDPNKALKKVGINPVPSP